MNSEAYANKTIRFESENSNSAIRDKYKSKRNKTILKLIWKHKRSQSRSNPEKQNKIVGCIITPNSCYITET